MRTIGLVGAAAVFALASCSPSNQATSAANSTPPDDAKEKAAEIVAASELIVLGRVAAVYDYTHRDGGMAYDVNVERTLHGSHSGDSLHFTSGGWIGYAKYAKGDRVLVFLRHWGDPPELCTTVIKGHDVLCYISGDMVAGPLGDRPLSEYIRLIQAAAKAAG